MGRSKVHCQGQGKRLCCSCGEPFKPHVRLKSRQLTCGKSPCKSLRHYQTLKAWRRKNPASTDRNREQAKLRARLKRKSLQRNLDILQVAKSPKDSVAFAVFATLQRV